MIQKGSYQPPPTLCPFRIRLCTRRHKKSGISRDLHVQCRSNVLVLWHGPERRLSVSPTLLVLASVAAPMVHCRVDNAVDTILLIGERRRVVGGKEAAARPGRRGAARKRTRRVLRRASAAASQH